MAAEFQRKITTQGDRWDSIAWEAYGDVSKIKELIEANPGMPLYPVFPDGITVIMPIIPEVDTQDSLLPPWLRSDPNVVEGVTYLVKPSAAATATKTSGFGADLENSEFDYFLDAPIVD